MAITTDNPADSTLLNPSGITLLTITLDTSHDRDGSLQSCNSHTNALGCGSVLTGQPLDLFLYTITLSAVGGTVSWGTFTAADPNYTPLGDDLADSHQTEFTRSRPAGSVTPAGLSTLGTIPVTVLSGGPTIEIARGTQPLDPFGFGTGFGGSCDALNFPNTYVLGDQSNPCATGDWFDADGIPRVPPNSAPLLNPIADMTVTEGLTGDQTISGSDPDGNALSFSKVSGPSYMTVSTTTPTTGTVHLATNFLDGGAFAAARASDGLLSADRAFVIHVIQGGTHAPIIDPVPDVTAYTGEVMNQEVQATDPDARTVTFVKMAGPSFMTVTTIEPNAPTVRGNIQLRPGVSDIGIYTAVVGVEWGDNRSSWSFTITVARKDHPPSVRTVGSLTIPEGTTSTVRLEASDQDGDVICLRPVRLPSFATTEPFVCGSGSVTLSIQFSPGYNDAGLYYGLISESSTNFLTSDILPITVTNVDLPNRCPIAQAGPPQTGLVPGSVTFDGRGSSDPDGDPLTYAWDFDAADGITADAAGAIASHVYSSAGSFTVTLTVTDNGHGDPAQACGNSGTTTVTITSECPATVLNGYDTIRLGSGKPFWFGYVQTFSGCFSNPDVVLSSFVMEYAGRQVPAEVTKATVGSDKNGDGIPEIRVTFSKANLRTLFNGIPNGHNVVAVTIKASTLLGRTLVGTTQLEVVNNGDFTASAVAPNPLNPEATLTYTTTKQGFVRIDMFDIQGRLVRRLVDAPAMTAGTHDVKIDGRGEREKLPSGVYYIRGTSSEGEFKHLITILK